MLKIFKKKPKFVQCPNLPHSVKTVGAVEWMEYKEEGLIAKRLECEKKYLLKEESNVSIFTIIAIFPCEPEIMLVTKFELSASPVYHIFSLKEMQNKKIEPCRDYEQFEIHVGLNND